MAENNSITEVPLLDLNAQYECIKDEIREAIDQVLESQYFIMGPEVEKFEREAAEYSHTTYAIGCASGSDALLLSLMAMEIGDNDAVITSPYTFFATGGAIARVGAIPVFLDIDPVSYNIDPGNIKVFMEGRHPLNRKLNISPGQVKGIMPVHLFGQMADMDPITGLAEEYGLKVIEDAAQAIGSVYKGRRAGTIGDTGCFSFFPSKNLGAYGDGGMITTDDDSLAERLRMLRLHGAKPKYHHKMVGINSRLDAIQAAVLRVKLQYLDRWSEARREKAQCYRELFGQAGLLGDNSFEKQTGQVAVPVENTGSPENGGRHIYHQYVIRTGKRAQVTEALKEHNIGYAVYYPVALHMQECFAYLGYKPGDCLEAIAASETSLALPVYPELSYARQEFVVGIIERALKK